MCRAAPLGMGCFGSWKRRVVARAGEGPKGIFFFRSEVSHFGPYVHVKVRDPRPAGTARKKKPGAVRSDGRCETGRWRHHGFSRVGDLALRGEGRVCDAGEAAHGSGRGRRGNERLDEDDRPRERDTKHTEIRRWTRNRNTDARENKVDFFLLQSRELMHNIAPSGRI